MTRPLFRAVVVPPVGMTQHTNIQPNQGAGRRSVPLRAVYWCIIVLGLLFVGRAASTLAAEPRQELDAAFAKKLESLAEKCESLGLKEEASLTRAWIIPRHPGRQYLFLPEPTDPAAVKSTAPKTQQQWHAKFREHRAAQADALWKLAQTELAAQHASLSYQLLHEVLRESPDHAEARRVLGYRKAGNTWLLGAAIPSPTTSRKAHPKFGWEGGKYWRLETTHYSIVTDTSAKDATDLGRKLEDLHALWRQVYFAFWTNPEALKHRLDGGAEPLIRAPKKMDVVLFKDREEYVSKLSETEPKIGLTTGIYLDQQQTVFLFGGEERLVPTWYHEATHQLFQQIDRFAAGTGKEQNYWVVEGLALYMESLASHDRGRAGTFWTLGGWDSDRLQFARYRGLSGDYLLPIAKLAALGRDEVQQSPLIRRFYGQAAGFSHFLLDGNDGSYHDAAVSLMHSVYERKDRVEAIASLTGVEAESLDKQYLDYLNVTDEQLATILAPERLRNLSLGRTTVTDAGLAHLAGCKNLDWLDLSLTKTTDVGLANFKGAEKLTQLFLEGTKVTDESLKIIGTLKELEELDLSALGITDDGLAALSGLKKLRILHLTNSPIGDPGLMHLRELTNLQSLDTTGTKVTEGGQEALKKALPKLVLGPAEQ